MTSKDQFHLKLLYGEQTHRPVFFRTGLTSSHPQGDTLKCKLNCVKVNEETVPVNIKLQVLCTRYFPHCLKMIWLQPKHYQVDLSKNEFIKRNQQEVERFQDSPKLVTQGHQESTSNSPFLPCASPSKHLPYPSLHTASPLLPSVLPEPDPPCCFFSSKPRGDLTVTGSTS